MAMPSHFQSLLFVPGSRPERIAKALASGADLVCVDLEDAVGPADKDGARAAALAAMGPDRLGLRVNGLRTCHGLADLLAVGAAAVAPAFVMVPMVEHAAELEIVAAALPRVPLMPLVETPRGLAHAASIAAAPGVRAVMLGGADFAGTLGVAMGWDALFAARGALAIACAGAGVAAIDAPWLALDDLGGLQAETARVAAMGFAAKSIVHPAHVAPAHAALRPSAAQLAEARGAEEAYRAGGEQAVRWGGTMLEAPVMARYRRWLALGEAEGEKADA